MIVHIPPLTRTTPLKPKTVPISKSTKADVHYLPGVRRKVLNIIYFVDANKTRSIKLPIKWFITILIMLLSSMVWTMVSIGNHLWNSNKASENHQRIEQLLGIIFEYQSRYDQVFEKAYPSHIESKKVDDDKQLSQTAPNEMPAEKIIVQDPVLIEPPTQKATELSDNGLPLIEDIKVSRNDKFLNLSFSIRKPKDFEKSRGNLWAVAEFESITGERKLISAPSDLSLNKDGTVNHLQGTIFYSIRFFKPNQLKFPLPTEDSKLVGLKIHIKSSTGETASKSVPFASAEIN